jgi:hypothetical protein
MQCHKCTFNTTPTHLQVQGAQPQMLSVVYLAVETRVRDSHMCFPGSSRRISAGAATPNCTRISMDASYAFLCARASGVSALSIFQTSATATDKREQRVLCQQVLRRTSQLERVVHRQKHKTARLRLATEQHSGWQAQALCCSATCRTITVPTSVSCALCQCSKPASKARAWLLLPNTFSFNAPTPLLEHTESTNLNRLECEVHCDLGTW